MATWENVRRIALALPETTERTSRDTLDWRVKDKGFVWERPLRKNELAALGDQAPDGPILGARVADEGAKEALLADDPAVYFTTPHFEGYPAVLVRLDRIATEDLEELITEAWFARAPKRLAKEQRSTPAVVDLPLPTLLSQLWVAFVIEVDNDFERQMPHRTTIGRGSPGRGPWLVSLAMWSGFLRFVPDEGAPLVEIEARAGTDKLPLAGMQRWGYVKVGESVHPTGWGRRAAAIWRQVPGDIEARWRSRFGAEPVERLRALLADVVGQVDPEPPDWLPILGYGLWSRPGQRPPGHGAGEQGLDGLLAQVLVTFATEFEAGSPLSLAVCANVLRVLDDRAVQVRDVPSLAGISKEAATVATGLLEREGYATIETDPAATRTKVVALTPKGEAAAAAYRARIGQVEAAWVERFGADKLAALRETLSDLIGRRQDGRPVLALGLEPGADGWRAAKPYAAQTDALLRDPARALPHYPVVSHRGGFPDGS